MEEYIDRLKENLSPLESFQFGSIQRIVLKRTDCNIDINLVVNFHEGGPELYLSNDGVVSTVVRAGYDTDSVVVREDAGALIFGFDKSSVHKYVYVGDANIYVGKILFAGKYIDSDGKEYVFNEDGTAIFSGEKMTYSVGIDHILRKFNHFEVNNFHPVYGFKRFDNKLYVYRVSGEEDENVEVEPFLKLTRKAN